MRDPVHDKSPPRHVRGPRPMGRSATHPASFDGSRSGLSVRSSAGVQRNARATTLCRCQRRGAEEETLFLQDRIRAAREECFQGVTRHGAEIASIPTVAVREFTHIIEQANRHADVKRLRVFSIDQARSAQPPAVRRVAIPRTPIEARPARGHLLAEQQPLQATEESSIQQLRHRLNADVVFADELRQAGPERLPEVLALGLCRRLSTHRLPSQFLNPQ